MKHTFDTSRDTFNTVSRMLLLTVLALAHPLYMGAQPAWTQIVQLTGYTTEASGQYSQMNNGSATRVSDTNVASYPNLVIPSSPYGGTNDSACASPPSWWTASVPPQGPSRAPHARMVSNYGPIVGSYKGFGFYGTFGGGSVGSGAGSIQEAVFFHEQPCYFGGREYGFTYDPVSDYLSVYWSTNTNCGSSNCSAPPGFNLGTEISGPTYTTFIQPGTGFSSVGSTCTASSPCFFEMYPVASGSSCYFHVNIWGPPNAQPPYANWYSRDTPKVDDSSQSPSVTSADPGFCSSILSEHGDITATNEYHPTLSSIPSSIKIWLDQESFTSGIFVGK